MNCAVVAYRSSMQRSPPVRRPGSGACPDTRRSNRPCATTTSTLSVSLDFMFPTQLKPSRTAGYVTRMPGGVGGVAPRGVPLSRSSTQRRRSPTLLHVRSFRTERTNFADAVSSACAYAPSLLKFSNFGRLPAQSPDGHDEVLCPGMGVALPADSRQQQGTILPLPDRLRPRSTAKSRPNLNCKGRSQAAIPNTPLQPSPDLPTDCQRNGQVRPASPLAAVAWV
jgi:hypothetical protein